MILRLFIDASAIFTMAHSPKGASYALHELAKAQKVTLVTSGYAIAEANRKIALKYPSYTDRLKEIVSIFTLVDVEFDDIAQAFFVVTDPYDAPIVAAAKKANVQVLVSFDKKHLHTTEVESFLQVPVLTAGEALEYVRVNTQ